MKNYLIIFLIACCSISSFATGKAVVIKGSIKGIKGFVYAKQPVKILIIEDFITNTKKVIKSGFTDEFGNYELSVSILKTQFAFIQFKKVERTLYIAPGKSYFINVFAPIKDLENSHGFFCERCEESRNQEYVSWRD